MDGHEDSALVQRAQQGDSRALDILWCRHRRWLAAVVLAHKPMEAEVEDLLQDIALTLVRKVRELREPAKLRPWLRMIALNAARSAGRKATVRRRVLRPLAGKDLEIADPAVNGGLRGLEGNRAAQRVLAATLELPVIYREVLVLRCVEGHSQRQIAAALEIPETTVESRLARGRRMLRQELATQRKQMVSMGTMKGS